MFDIGNFAEDEISFRHGGAHIIIYLVIERQKRSLRPHYLQSISRKNATRDYSLPNEGCSN